VLEHLRRERQKREAMSQLYVVDDKGRLIDFVRLRNLVVAPPNLPVGGLLEGQRIFLRATDPEESAVAAFKKYGSTMLPVVDSGEVLIGVVTVDDVLDIAEREATEDIQKLGGVEALDAPYLKISLLSMVRKRAGWLSILFISEMFTATAMGYFEEEIAKAAVLALFLPLILSSGGNSGSRKTGGRFCDASCSLVSRSARCSRRSFWSASSSGRTRSSFTRSIGRGLPRRFPAV
jgi:magnesium transporter